MNVSSIILSAGESSRMGRPKTFLKDLNSEFFISNQINTYKSFGCNEIIVVTNESILQYTVQNNIDSLNEVIIVTNKKLELGRFYSIKIGLEALIDIDYCFIHNVDNPLNDTEVLEKLYSSRNISDIVVPEKNNKTGHPILINKSIINKIKQAPHIDIIFNEFLKKFNKKSIEVITDNIHLNINTQSNYENYLNKE